MIEMSTVCCLLFGVSTASEIFQNAIAEVPPTSGVKNLSDDIIIYGKTEVYHDLSLKAMLKQFEKRGAKLNREKYKVLVDEFTFLRHVLSTES